MVVGTDTMESVKENWMWHYTTLINNSLIQCDICYTTYRIEITMEPLLEHILNEHMEVYYYSALETARMGLAMNLNQYYVMLYGQATCRSCNISFLHYKINTNIDLEIHLHYIHETSWNKTYSLYDWLCLYFNIYFDERYMYYVQAHCNLCNTIFIMINSFALMKHLCDNHQILVPLCVKPQQNR